MSRVRRRLFKCALGVAPALALSGMLLSACVGPSPEAGAALHQWLADVRIHSVAYAYTLLTRNAEERTRYDVFFAGVNASHATFKVMSLKVISANDVEAVVQVKNPGGAQPTTVKVQVLEEGNAGDWLVGAPFSTQGARAIANFK
ncbi:MAG TPA: hypothetical protein VNH38_01770 [Candidatus Dormibacteraeota bacterium]|nr:hypothetical protein [Candidatus Dormibacteraeota bacterium]